MAIAVAVAAGLDHGGSFSDNWVASVAGVAILASATASVVTGLLAMTRHHDHTWLVMTATVLGVLVALLGLQQVAEGLGWLSS